MKELFCKKGVNDKIVNNNYAFYCRMENKMYIFAAPLEKTFFKKAAKSSEERNI
jgi:hypothetical protein